MLAHSSRNVASLSRGAVLAADERGAPPLPSLKASFSFISRSIGPCSTRVEMYVQFAVT